MKLRDLPVRPDLEECVLSYFNELKKVTSTEELKAHTERWKAMWAINFPRETGITPEEQSIIDGTYNVEEALKCVPQCFQPYDGCEHSKGNDERSCVGMHISMPVIVIKSETISHHYGVPVDIALIQMCGGFGELYG